MDTKDLRKARVLLETAASEKIQELLTNFEKGTGISVTNMAVTVEREVHANSTSLNEVRTKVTMDV